MDLLKRELAPIVDEAWSAIDDEARTALKTTLSARKFVDVDGPYGWDYTAAGAGRLDLPGAANAEGIRFGVYRVQPLLEFRTTFELNIWELDNIKRGADDVNLEPVTQAAERAAHFEDNVVFQGMKQDAGIVGLQEAASDEHETIALGQSQRDALDAISRAILTLQDAAVEGPYCMVAGPDVWRQLASFAEGYPLYRHVERLIEGPVIYSPAVQGAYLISQRGGDLQLILGQDFSIGYESHTSEAVKLFLTESFTFRILDPAVAVPMRYG